MIASLITGDDSPYTIAFAISPTENQNYWTRFLTSLSDALDLRAKNDMVIISDIDKGFENAIKPQFQTIIIHIAFFTSKKYQDTMLHRYRCENVRSCKVNTIEELKNLMKSLKMKRARIYMSI